MTNIAVVGQAGESCPDFAPAVSTSANHSETDAILTSISQPEETIQPPADRQLFISPRARSLAQRKGVAYDNLQGSGPGGRIIERDIEAAIRERVNVTPVAQAMLASGEFKLAELPSTGARVTKSDLQPAIVPGAIREIPLKGIRKTIAKRMLESLQTTAQLTLNATADARALQALRRRFKESDEALGLCEVNINDLLLLALARTLPAFPDLNALFENETIYQFDAVHLAQAVDTDRGLLVPVIRNADSLTLKQISAEAQRLARACRDGSVLPDELTGGTFTVSNLGALGIESFTPVLNPPQVGILGIGCINLKPIPGSDGVEFVPHIGLSLTINHQVVDGAPAARFLQQLSANLAQIDLLAI